MLVYLSAGEAEDTSFTRMGSDDRDLRSSAKELKASVIEAVSVRIRSPPMSLQLHDIDHEIHTYKSYGITYHGSNWLEITSILSHGAKTPGFEMETRKVRH